MIYIFDLDHTLFDTDRLLSDLPEVLGVDAAAFRQSYEKNFKKKPLNYSVYRHINFLIREGCIRHQDSVNIRRRVIALLKNVDEYVGPEAEPWLKTLIRRGHKLILLTYGDLVWQKSKLKHLRLKKYFAKVVITDQDKDRALGFLAGSHEKIMIVNDNARECLQIREALGDRAEIILVKGPYSDNVKHDLRVYSRSRLGKLFDDTA